MRRAPTVTVATFRDDPLYPGIARAVAAILEQGKVVTPVDVLVGVSLLAPTSNAACFQCANGPELHC